MNVKVSEMNDHQRELYEARKKRMAEKRRAEGILERVKGRQPRPKRVRKKKIAKSLRVYVADFETSTEKWFNEKGETEVWAWAITSVEPNRKEPLDLTENAEVVMNVINDKTQYAERRFYTEMKPIESFFNELSRMQYDDSIIYFHNIKFDGSFIISYLLNTGFEDVSAFQYGIREEDDKTRYVMTKNTYAILGDSSTWYSIKVNLNGLHIEFRDSLKRIPMSVRQMAKEYKLPILKGDIDYDRDPSLPISPEEEQYIRHDVLIVAEVLRQQYQEGFTELTTASFSYNQYKRFLLSKDEKLEDIFTPLEMTHSNFARKAYEGGEVFCNPEYQGQFLGDPYNESTLGFTWDINSMYPAVYSCIPMPWGIPTTYRDTTVFRNVDFGDYQNLQEWRGVKWRYFIQVVHCIAVLKENRIPSISVTVGFNKRVYPKSLEINNKIFADVRYEMMLRDYDVIDLSIGRLDRYFARQDLFFDYVKGIVNEKNKAGIEGNVMRKALAKVKMNSLYGKFAQKEESVSVAYKLDENGVLESIHFMSLCASKYVPLASIITAEARNLLVSQANKFGYKNVIYMDTDSIHTLAGHSCKAWRRRPLPENKEEKLKQMNDSYDCETLYKTLLDFENNHPNEIWCDEFDLGAFKIENSYQCGKWLRAKTYFEGNVVPKEVADDYYDCVEKEIDKKEYENLYIIKGKDFYLLGQIKGAGIPDESKQQIQVDNFDFGLILHGKLLPCRVKGGTILKESLYEIKEDLTLGVTIDKPKS